MTDTSRHNNDTASRSRGQSNYPDQSIGELRSLHRKRQELDDDIDKLQLEIAELQKLSRVKEQHEQTYNSASRDARKMYGDITPGDITHQDVTLDYTNHFKHAHRNLPKSFPPEQKYEVWKMSADIVQASFDVNKEKIVTKVMDDLNHALNIDEDDQLVLEESTQDLHRAFKEFIKNMSPEKKEEVKRKVLGSHNLQPVNERAFQLVMNAITELDPADYKAFVTKGELRDRVADYREYSSKPQ